MRREDLEGHSAVKPGVRGFVDLTLASRTAEGDLIGPPRACCLEKSSLFVSSFEREAPYSLGEDSILRCGKSMRKKDLAQEETGHVLVFNNWEDW